MRVAILVPAISLMVSALVSCDNTPDVVYNADTNTVVCNDEGNCVTEDPNSPDNRVLQEGEQRP